MRKGELNYCLICIVCVTNQLGCSHVIRWEKAILIQYQQQSVTVFLVLAWCRLFGSEVRMQTILAFRGHGLSMSLHTRTPPLAASAVHTAYYWCYNPIMSYTFGIGRGDHASLPDAATKRNPIVHTAVVHDRAVFSLRYTSIFALETSGAGKTIVWAYPYINHCHPSRRPAEEYYDSGTSDNADELPDGAHKNPRKRTQMPCKPRADEGEQRLARLAASEPSCLEPPG